MTLLNNKKLVVMGVANKWSIAWGIAKKFHQEKWPINIHLFWRQK